jgi:beta-1,4-N-acetylglucosaminyltransferase
MRILFIVGSGGHTAQMLKLMDKLNFKGDYGYVINADDVVTRQKLKMGKKIYALINPRRYNESFFNKFIRTIYDFFEALIILKDYDIIISAGPGLTVPIFYAGKIMGKKLIFLESWSRVNTPSLSGRLVYPISHLFFVQWPQLKKKYPKSIYAGRLS